MIRYASTQDIAHLVDLAREEHSMSAWRADPFEPGVVEAMASTFIRSPGHTVLMSDGGYLAGLIQPTGFNRRLMAVEFAWFARDGSGMALLRRFEAWAKAIGAIDVVVHTHCDHRGVDRVLGRRNYQTTGKTMVKRLEH